MYLPYYDNPTSKPTIIPMTEKMMEMIRNALSFAFGDLLKRLLTQTNKIILKMMVIPPTIGTATAANFLTGSMSSPILSSLAQS